MTTATPVVILIHGAWLGGFSWYALAPRLSLRGVPGLAPSLSGCADQHDAMDTHTGLHAHAQEIAALVLKTGSKDITLVGHSYGAAVASEVAGQLPDCIRRLVILDGFLGEAGRSLMDSYPILDTLFTPLIAPDAPTMMQVPPAQMVGLDEGPDHKWITARMRPMPVAAFRDPCRYSALNLACDRQYIRFTEFPVFAEDAARARQHGWRVTEINAGHMAILSHAEEIANLISS